MKKAVLILAIAIISVFACPLLACNSDQTAGTYYFAETYYLWTESDGIDEEYYVQLNSDGTGKVVDNIELPLKYFLDGNQLVLLVKYDDGTQQALVCGIRDGVVNLSGSYLCKQGINTPFKEYEGLRYCVGADGNYEVSGLTDDQVYTAAIPTQVDNINVTSIGAYAFDSCRSLEDVIIGRNVTNIGTGAFSACRNLESATIGNGVVSIGRSAFADCVNLVSVSIGKNVKYIEQFAFFNCSRLKSLAISESVTRIGTGAFYGCSGLEHITVAPSNEYYYSVDNCLISESTLLVGCKTSVIPSDGSVTRIGAAAFAGCNGLESIVIPEGVTIINGNAFQNCHDLTSVIISDSVKQIDGSVFAGCNSLQAIYFAGTAEQWNDIYMAYEVGFEDIERYYYSEGVPNDDGNYWHYIDGEPIVWGREI